MDSHLKGWIAAGDLKKGDKLVSKDGSIEVVEEVTVEKLSTPVKVYNLEVEGNHNYYDRPKDVHRLKSGNGIHTNDSPLGQEWNSIWNKFIEKSPNATVKEILQKLLDMANKAGISDYGAKAKKQ